MRAYKKVAAVLVVLAVLAVGFALPRAALALQDSRLQGQVARHEVEGIHFDAAAPLDMGARLRVLAGEYTTVHLEEGSVLDAEGAHQAAREFLAWLRENGLLLAYGAVLEQHSESPFLAVADDEAEAEAVVVWQCELADGDRNEVITILIDDETGVMLSFLQANLRGQTLTESTTDADQAGQATQKMAEVWADMLTRYYGYQDCAVARLRGDATGAEYAMTFSSQAGEEVTLNCYISAGLDMTIINVRGPIISG